MCLRVTTVIAACLLLGSSVEADLEQNSQDLLQALVGAGFDNSSEGLLEAVLNNVFGKLQNGSFNSTELFPSNITLSTLSTTAFPTDSDVSLTVTPEIKTPFSETDHQDIHQIIDSIQKITNNSTNTDRTDSILKLFNSALNVSVPNADILEKFVEASSAILKENTLSNEISSDIVMKTMECLVSTCPANSTYSLSSDTMDIDIGMVQNNIDSPYVVYSTDTGAKMEISDDLFGNNGGKVSTIVYKTVDKSLPSYQGASVSSIVVSITVNIVIETGQVKPDLTSDAVVIILPTELKDGLQEKERLCVYWLFDTSEWARDGCMQREKNSTHTTCMCNHFTNFAVLVLYYEPEAVSADQRNVLDILTTVGCGLSIAGLVMTLLIYVYFRILQRGRIMLHANLAIALLLAQLVLITSHDAGVNNRSEDKSVQHKMWRRSNNICNLQHTTADCRCYLVVATGRCKCLFVTRDWDENVPCPRNPVQWIWIGKKGRQPEAYNMLCRAVAVMLHYLFMSAFSWMLVEGVALYISCTKSLHNIKDVRLKYFMIGWGVPVIVVLVSLGIEFQDYGSGPENSCWLSAENGLIWAFMGPMVLIVLFNVIILAMVIKVFLTLKANARKSEAERIRCSIRAMILLLPILGVTWLLSLLVPISSAFHFLFVIGNSIQGLMIFFLHCVCNEEVRKKFREKRRKLMSRRTSSETDVSYVVARRPPLVFMEDLPHNTAGLPAVG